VDVVLFSRVWQTLSCSQRYILRGVLVGQILENKPTAYLGWAPFGDVILKRTAVILGKAGDMSSERRKGTAFRSRPFFSRRHLSHSVDVVSFSRVWQTLSCSQRYILRGVLVGQTLENKPTAYLGWAPFGDVILKRTAVMLGKAGDMSPERRKGTALGSGPFLIYVFRRFKDSRVQGFASLHTH